MTLAVAEEPAVPTTESRVMTLAVAEEPAPTTEPRLMTLAVEERVLKSAAS